MCSVEKHAVLQKRLDIHNNTTNHIESWQKSKFAHRLQVCEISVKSVNHSPSYAWSNTVSQGWVTLYMATHPYPYPPTTLVTLRLRKEKAGLSQKQEGEPGA